MSVCGIIAEYNPFHNGHLYQLGKVREFADDVVAVMSGNFVQRGEPAVMNKLRRAETAVKCGVDLVVELPFQYACGSAGLFAEGAVKLLNDMGIADYLCFGSECGDAGKLKSLAGVIACESPEMSRALKTNLDTGMGFMRARSCAIADVHGLAYPDSPNDVLAVEYVAALLRLGSNIQPIAIKRNGEYHSDRLGRISSASAIRRAIFDNSVKPADIESAVPPPSYESITAAYKAGELNRIENCFPALRYLLASKDTDELRGIFGVLEGLENRLKQAQSAQSLDEMIYMVKSKRYNYSSISRVLMYLLAGLTKERRNALDTDYIRVLAVRKEKTYLLTRMSQTAKRPIITSPNAKTAFETALSDIYNASTPRGGAPGWEWRQKFIITDGL